MFLETDPFWGHESFMTETLQLSLWVSPFGNSWFLLDTAVIIWVCLLRTARPPENNQYCGVPELDENWEPPADGWCVKGACAEPGLQPGQPWPTPASGREHQTVLQGTDARWFWRNFLCADDKIWSSDKAQQSIQFASRFYLPHSEKCERG
jgi:hypothetical protein